MGLILSPGSLYYRANSPGVWHAFQRASGLKKVESSEPREKRGWGWGALWKPHAQLRVLDWEHQGRQPRFVQDIPCRWDMTSITSCWFCSKCAVWPSARLSPLWASIPPPATDDHTPQAQYPSGGDSRSKEAASLGIQPRTGSWRWRACLEV